MKKKQIIALIGISAISFYPLIYFIGIIFPNAQMLQFPLSSQIWGSVSDWLMFFATVLTAIYLIKTFKAQRDTTEIEQKRFLREIRPEFEAFSIREDYIDDLNATEMSGLNYFFIDITFSFVCKKNPAKNLTIDLAPHSSRWKIDKSSVLGSEYVNIDDVIKITLKLQGIPGIRYTSPPKPFFHEILAFQIKFSDEEDILWYTQYISQELIYKLDSRPICIIPKKLNKATSK